MCRISLSVWSRTCIKTFDFTSAFKTFVSNCLMEPTMGGILSSSEKIQLGVNSSADSDTSTNSDDDVSDNGSGIEDISSDNDVTDNGSGIEDTSSDDDVTDNESGAEEINSDDVTDNGSGAEEINSDDNVTDNGSGAEEINSDDNVTENESNDENITVDANNEFENNFNGNNDVTTHESEISENTNGNDDDDVTNNSKSEAENPNGDGADDVTNFISEVKKESGIVVPEIFIRAILKDAEKRNLLTEYETGWIPDSLLAELVKIYSAQRFVVVTNKVDKPVTLASSPDRPTLKTALTTKRHLSFRLQEFKRLRDLFPDLASYRVQRSSTEHERLLDKERYMVQVCNQGFYMKKSTLLTCKFFRKMFKNDMQETESGRCHLRGDKFLCPDETFCAILTFLCDRNIDYEKHSWEDILVASDYLGCESARKHIDLYLSNGNDWIDLDDAIILLHNIETRSGWHLPITGGVCTEIIKANVHFLVHEDFPFELIGCLSKSVITKIMTDPRLTYFTMIERKGLLWKWFTKTKNNDHKETLLGFLDNSDETCSSLPSHMRFVCRNQTAVGCNRRKPTQVCLSHPTPAIILAGGTGCFEKFSSNGEYVRPLNPSKSLMAYNIEKNTWHILPDLPVCMVKPLVATNNEDQIYIIDSHSFREQDLIHKHYLFTLEFTRLGWKWKSFMMEVPVGIRSFRLHHFFCVDKKFYFLGIGRIYGQVMNEWNHGAEYRQNLLSSFRYNCPNNERDVVTLLDLNVDSGGLKVVKFAFHVEKDFDDLLKACVVGHTINVGVHSGYVLNGNPTFKSQILAAYNCKENTLHTEVGSPVPVTYEVLVASPDQSSIIAVTMGGCCFRRYDSGESGCWVRLTNMVIPYPPHPVLPVSESSRTSYMMVSDHDSIYYLGGLSDINKVSLATGVALTFPSMNDRPRWRNLPSMPRKAMHCGAVSCSIVKQCLDHHPLCPHCKVYPQDALMADTSQVCLPENYEANLFATYPPKDKF